MVIYHQKTGLIVESDSPGEIPYLLNATESIVMPISVRQFSGIGIRVSTDIEQMKFDIYIPGDTNRVKCLHLVKAIELISLCQVVDSRYETKNYGVYGKKEHVEMFDLIHWAVMDMMIGFLLFKLKNYPCENISQFAYHNAHAQSHIFKIYEIKNRFNMTLLFPDFVTKSDEQLLQHFSNLLDQDPHAFQENYNAILKFLGCPFQVVLVRQDHYKVIWWLIPESD